MRDPRPGGHNRYPGYDVLSKRPGPSWNEQTRRVISRRLAIAADPHFFTTEEFRTVIAIAARIAPQPTTGRQGCRVTVTPGGLASRH
jgi:hypothetical protein